jgi:hypothetical protein
VRVGLGVGRAVGATVDDGLASLAGAEADADEAVTDGERPGTPDPLWVGDEPKVVPEALGGTGLALPPHPLMARASTSTAPGPSRRIAGV